MLMLAKSWPILTPTKELEYISNSKFNEDHIVYISMKFHSNWNFFG